jgi:NADH-quinone oxidoreductase subunit M
MPDLNSLILSCLIFCPLVGAVILALLPRRVAREGAFTVALINFVFSLHLVARWNDAAGNFRFEQNLPWLPQFGLNYHLGVDGLSLLLILLTTFLMPIVILASWNSVQKHTKAFFVFLLLLEAALCGVFSALDVILFYVFYEAVLVPIYLLIGIWGGGRRFYASIKYFLANFAGSVLMWIAMFYVYFQQPEGSRSFDWQAFVNGARNLDATPIAIWLFAGFAIAFAIKSALFPLHTPAPDAYGEAPTAGSVFLSAVLAKIGTYGFLRFVLPSFPETSTYAAPTMIMLGLIAVIYAAMAAAVQKDFKRVIAYSSISHVGLIVAGIFGALLANESADINFSQVAISGAALQMFNHGISTAALFILLGMLFERRGTQLISQYGGLAKPMPRFAVLFWIALFSSIGLPGLNGFIGEYLLLQGLMSAKLLYAALGATGVILGAVYMLKLSRNLLFGEITHEENRALPDVNKRETFVVVALLLVALWVGVRPQSFLDFVNPDAAKVAGAASTTQLAQNAGN